MCQVRNKTHFIFKYSKFLKGRFLLYSEWLTDSYLTETENQLNDMAEHKYDVACIKLKDLKLDPVAAPVGNHWSKMDADRR